MSLETTITPELEKLGLVKLPERNDMTPYYSNTGGLKTILNIDFTANVYQGNITQDVRTLFENFGIQHENEI